MPTPSDDIVLFKKDEALRLETYYPNPKTTAFNAPGFQISKSHFAHYFEHQFTHGKKTQDSEITDFMKKALNLTLHFSTLEMLINRREPGNNEDAVKKLKTNIEKWQTALEQKIDVLNLKTQTPYIQRQIHDLKNKTQKRTQEMIAHLNTITSCSGETLRYLHSPMDLSWSTPSLGRMITELELLVMNFSKNVARHISPTPALNAIREHLSMATLSDLKKAYELQGYGLQGNMFRSAYHPYSETFAKRLDMDDKHLYAYEKPLNNPKKAERMVCSTYDLNYQEFRSSFQIIKFILKILVAGVEILILALRLIINLFLTLIYLTAKIKPSEDFKKIFNAWVEKIDQIHEKYSPLSWLQQWENDIQFKHWHSKLPAEIDKFFDDPYYLRALEIFEAYPDITKEGFKTKGGNSTLYFSLKEKTSEEIKNLKILRLLKDCQLDNFLFEIGKDSCPGYSMHSTTQPPLQTFSEFKAQIAAPPEKEESFIHELQHTHSNHFLSPFEIIGEIAFAIDNEGVNAFFRKSPLPAALNFAFCFSGFIAFIAPQLAVPVLSQAAIQTINAINRSFCGQNATVSTSNMVMGSFLSWSLSTSIGHNLTGSLQEQHDCLDDMLQDPVKPLFIFASLVLIGNVMGMAYIPETFKIAGIRYHNYIAIIFDKLFEETKLCQNGIQPFALITEALIAGKTLMLTFNLVESSHHQHHTLAIQNAPSITKSSNPDSMLVKYLKALAQPDAKLLNHLNDKPFAKEFYQDLLKELKSYQEQNYDYSALTEAFFAIYCQETSYNLINLITFWAFPLYAVVWGICALMQDEFQAKKYQKLSAQKLLITLDLILPPLHMLAEFFKCLIDYLLINLLRVIIATLAIFPIAIEALYTKQELKATQTFDLWKYVDECIHACHLHYWTPMLFKPLQILVAKISYYAATTQDIAPIAEEALRHYLPKNA
jgi:hypothetical protein